LETDRRMFDPRHPALSIRMSRTTRRRTTPRQAPKFVEFLLSAATRMNPHRDLKRRSAAHEGPDYTCQFHRHGVFHP
jgi:hypothetical protein